MSEPKYKIGDRVYYIGTYKLVSAKLTRKTDYKLHGMSHWETDKANHFREDHLFPTKEALLNHIKQQLEELE